MDKDYPKPVSVWASIPGSLKGAFLSDDGGESGWGDAARENVTAECMKKERKSINPNLRGKM